MEQALYDNSGLLYHTLCRAVRKEPSTAGRTFTTRMTERTIEPRYAEICVMFSVAVHGAHASPLFLNFVTFSPSTVPVGATKKAELCP